MPPLELEPRIEGADAFYAALVNVHEGLSLEESFALQTRLVLILANQVGEADRLAGALQAARG